MYPLTDSELLALAEANQAEARELIAASGIVDIWQRLGVTVRQVGSLATGLLMTHRDFDFHLYSPRPEAATGFEAMRRLALVRPLQRLSFNDGMDTSERCLEYHAWVASARGNLWQIDMIHIESGSQYDGWAEEIAERIKASLTPQTRLAILRLKYLTPENEKVFGIEYCKAVLSDGVRDYPEFMEWRKRHPQAEMMDWKGPDNR